MSDFSIGFANPWLLFLLIPALLLTLIPFLRLPKKFRRTRNRVISVDRVDREPEETADEHEEA